MTTDAQQRWLEEITEAGVKIFNGRARRVIKALEEQGLVEVEWDSHVSNNNEIIVAWPTGAPSYRRGQYEDQTEWLARIRRGDHD